MNPFFPPAGQPEVDVGLHLPQSTHSLMVPSFSLAPASKMKDKDTSSPLTMVGFVNFNSLSLLFLRVRPSSNPYSACHSYHPFPSHSLRLIVDLGWFSCYVCIFHYRPLICPRLRSLRLSLDCESRRVVLGITFQHQSDGNCYLKKHWNRILQT